jgi:hypothetical protein
VRVEIFSAWADVMGGGLGGGLRSERVKTGVERVGGGVTRRGEGWLLDCWWRAQHSARLTSQARLFYPGVLHVTRCWPRPHQNIRPKISGTPLNLISSHLRSFPPINSRRALYISSEPLISVGAPEKANSCFRRRSAAPWTEIATRLTLSPSGPLAHRPIYGPSRPIYRPLIRADLTSQTLK